jgi:hypothetical protein
MHTDAMMDDLEAALTTIWRRLEMPLAA